MPLEHSVLSPDSSLVVPIGNYRNSGLQSRIYIFSGTTSWVKRQLPVISVASFSPVEWRDGGMCHVSVA